MSSISNLLSSTTTPQPLDTSADTPMESHSSPSSRVKRMSAAVEKTVDKLSRSMSGRGTQLTSPTSQTGRSRLFSVSRKGKARDTSAEDGGMS